MSETKPAAARVNESKARVIMAGAAIGAAFGLLSGYLYTRAADEEGNADAGARASASTGQLLAILLAALGLARQIAELGKPKKNDKKDEG